LLAHARPNAKERSQHLGVCALPGRRAGHSFLQAQSGLFTWAHGWERAFLESGMLPTLEDALRAAADKEAWPDVPLLEEIKVPSSCAEQLLSRLQKHGISKARLKPTLDNVTETMKLEALMKLSKDRIPATYPRR
jgi:hypothetical protein